MRVYLDNCCYNRPFDDQSQISIKLETMAKLSVQFMMASGAIEYVWSKVLDYEVSFNPFPKRKAAIKRWPPGAIEYVEVTEQLIVRGEELERHGLKPKDALHLAAAEAAHCDYFLTTDRGILKKMPVLGTMKVLNPVNFITEVMHDNH